MYKKLLSFFTTLSLVAFSTPAYSSEITKETEYKISDATIEYQIPTAPIMQNYKKELYSKMVDPSKAMGLSALYFGLGQIYAGEQNRGAWIMAGGTVLTAGILLVVLPRLANRQEGVTSVGTAISFATLGFAHILNIRDAYNTAEKINIDIKEKLLLSENTLKNYEKISLFTKNDSYGLDYQIVKF